MSFTLGGLAPASQLDHSAEDGISSREFIGIIVVYYSAYVIYFMQPEHTRHLLGSNINDCFFIFCFQGTHSSNTGQYAKDSRSSTQH